MLSIEHQQELYEARMAHLFKRGEPRQADHAGSPTTPTSEGRVDQGSQPSSGIDTHDVVQLPDQPSDGAGTLHSQVAEARAKVERADEALMESINREDPEETINALLRDKMQVLEQLGEFELFHSQIEEAKADVARKDNALVESKNKGDPEETINAHMQELDGAVRRKVQLLEELDTFNVDQSGAASSNQRDTRPIWYPHAGFDHPQYENPGNYKGWQPPAPALNQPSTPARATRAAQPPRQPDQAPGIELPEMNQHGDWVFRGPRQP